MNTYELDYKAQGIAYRRLLAAVVALAIQDAQAKPNKTISKRRLVPKDTAMSAIYFLFRTSDGYLQLLDIDPEQFRKKLLGLMFDMNKKVRHFEPIGRRNFRYNYQWMHRQENVLDLTKAYQEDLEKMEADEEL
jgi:crotonobetainyl-CoA:carnitine CoA-transferase CaiB-like acyl-CoA transferase